MFRVRLAAHASNGRRARIHPEEMDLLDPDSYRILDIRSAQQRAYGRIPGALIVDPDELTHNPPEDKNVMYVVCCSRGLYSLDTARRLSGLGYDARSLQGGYAAWLVHHM